jgi:PAS domain S-box-containing protein
LRHRRKPCAAKTSAKRGCITRDARLLSAAVPAETQFEEMKRYVRFDAGDARRLAAFRAHAGPQFPRIAAEFYDRIREHEQAHAVFSSEEQVDRLKASLVRWMERVCSGTYDEAYYAETAKIGRVHVRVGLPQRYMFTAMALIRAAFEEIADETMGADAAAVRRAVGQIFMLELAIMLETYRDDFIARLQHVERGERAQVDLTLARTEHRYVSAVELARVLIVGLDRRGTVRLWNAEAERVTGRARDEVLGASFVDALLPEGLREEHGPVFADAVNGKLPPGEILESVVRTRAGKVRDVRWQLAFTPSSADDEVVCFAIGHDTTDQNALAARVRHSEKLASVGTLAAGLAHEIRNPLNGAQLHVTFLERGLRSAGIADPDTLDAVKVVREEIHRLSVLVTEFLDFARPMPLTKKLVPLRAVAERVARLVASDAARAHAVLKLDLPSAEIELEIDAAKIEQVLLNVLQNAVEAVAPVGGGRVLLRLRRQPRHAVIEIEDEGSGLSNPDAPIFDPFFSTKPHGTGLGLAIAHRIVTDHEGTISVSSRPGRTVFQITLPVGL